MDHNMDWLSDFLDESIPLWRDDPVMFFREVLGFEPDEWQAEAVFRNNRYLACIPDDTWNVL